MPAATGRWPRHPAVPLPLILLTVVLLSGCGLPIPGLGGRETGTSLGTINLNTAGRRDLPSASWAGVYAGDDIAALDGVVRGDDELDRLADRLAQVDPGRSLVVVDVVDTCTRTDVQLRRHGKTVEVAWRRLDRACAVAAMRLFAWSVAYDDVPDPVTVTLCRSSWTVRGGTVSRTGEGGCSGD